MERSRLQRVRSRRAGKQGVMYLLLAVGLIVGMVIWGLPLAARLAGGLIKPGDDPRVVEELRPTPPIFSDVPESTFSAQVRVAGFSQPGMDVVLFLNGAEYGRKLVSESGTFTFDQISLGEGENTVYAYAATNTDLRSEQSRSYTITLDDTRPVVTIESPKDGEVFRGTSQRIATFNGSVDELGSRVYIGERMAIVGSEGKFSLQYQLIEGDQEIQIKATDKAGNVSESMIKLRWEP